MRVMCVMLLCVALTNCCSSCSNVCMCDMCVVLDIYSWVICNANNVCRVAVCFCCVILSTCVFVSICMCLWLCVLVCVNACAPWVQDCI